MGKRAYIAAAVCLLLIHFFIRTHNITSLEPYVDEGAHITRAAAVWDFSTHPAQFSNGKLLLYFWLGLFDERPSTNLAAGRLAVSVFSTITAATLCLLGRLLWDKRTGLLALAIYAFLPYAFFFERMALADAFAAGFAALVAWRGLVFARRLDLRQGVILGVLLGLASMAKLTMALLPLLPVGAALMQHNWKTGIRGYVQRYLPGLIAAALTVIILWLPILMPAYFAQQAGSPFVLVDEFNIRRDDPYAPTGPVDYLAQVLPLLAEFTSPVYLIGAGLALMAGWLGRKQAPAIFLTLWLLAIALPLILAARVVTARYLMPISTPMTLAVAAGLTYLWNRFAGMPVLRVGIAGICAVWLLAFAVPFMQAVPEDLPFTSHNAFDFHSGFLTADDRVREAATVLSSLPGGKVYATREACFMLYFYSDGLDLRCLPQDPIPTFGTRLLDELSPGETAYFVMSWYYGPFHLGIDWLNSEEIQLQIPSRFQGPGYEFRLWCIQKKARGLCNLTK
jgi:hypothetical protein